MNAPKITLTCPRCILYAINNIAFNYPGSYDDARIAAKDTILEAGLDAQAIARALNRSGLGYKNWRVVSEHPIKLEVVDRCQNVYWLVVD